MPRAFRVLCLHGMYQDARAFAAKTRHLSAACPELPLEFLYLDGPFTVVPPILARSAAASAAVATNAAASRARSAKRALHGAEARKKRAGEFRAWWRPLGAHQSDPREFERERALLLQFLRDKLRELGEVDGVMGFSQGASLAAWMCSEQGKTELGWTPKVAVLIGSYLGPPQYSVDASGVLAGIPSLHLFGSNDHVISASKSQRVADIFKQSALTDTHVETAAHNQGHVIPKGDAALTQFQRFLARNLLPADPVDSPTASSPPSPPPTRHDAPPTQDARA